MTRKRRDLTTEEKQAAATFARHFAEACKTRSQQAIADEIGVTQGAVWQWADGRVPITAKRARDAARAVGADPNEISVAFRSLNLAEQPKDTVASESHSARLNRETLHEALTLLLHDEQQAGPYAPRARARRLADLYELLDKEGGRLSDVSNAAFVREVLARGGKHGARSKPRGNR